MKRWMMSGLMSLVLCGASMEAGAISVSVDLDPGTVGIQSTRSVVAGTSFTVDVVLNGDGSTVFDTFGFDVFFNDMGAGVLGLSGGTGTPTPGSIGATAPISFVPLSLGPFPLTAPFTAQSGGVGGLSVVLPFGFPIAFSTTTTHSLFSLTFDALLPGMSTMLPSIGIPPLGGLALAGIPVSSTLTGGTLTVTDGQQAIPEPRTIFLFATGLGGILLGRRMWDHKSVSSHEANK